MLVAVVVVWLYSPCVPSCAGCHGDCGYGYGGGRCNCRIKLLLLVIVIALLWGCL
jgi:hypothetical protein